jgi:hypothetical protein
MFALSATIVGLIASPAHNVPGNLAGLLIERCKQKASMRYGIRRAHENEA